MRVSQRSQPRLPAPPAPRGGSADPARTVGLGSPDPAHDRCVETRRSAQAAIAPAPTHVSTEEWTWRLVDRGFTIAEAAAIRGLEPAAIIRHLTWMVRRGHQLAIESHLAARDDRGVGRLAELEP